MKKENFVLLIACADAPGLIHKITGALLNYRANILENQEFVDREKGRFFMRTAFETAEDGEAILRELKGLLPAPSDCALREAKTKRIVVFVSKEPHCLGDLLVRHELGELKAQIQAVISQTADCETLVKKFGIPFHHIPIAPAGREEHERRVLREVQNYGPEYLVLARYMRIFSAKFVDCYPGRMINIHHSFLPAFIGRDPYQQAYARGVKIIGATAHFVTSGLDEGPIICQGVNPVDHTHSDVDMARLGREIERSTLATGVNLVLDDRVIVDGRRTVVFK